MIRLEDRIVLQDSGIQQVTEEMNDNVFEDIPSRSLVMELVSRYIFHVLFGCTFSSFVLGVLYYW